VRLRLLQSMGKPMSDQTGSGQPRVLVVHDQIPQIRCLCRMLEGDHEVMSVASPTQALFRLGSDRLLDVILAPIMMAEMSGFEFAGLLRQARADLVSRLALMTSANIRSHVRNLQAGSRVRIVHRPEDLEAFRSVLAEVTGSRE
jgi:CheY-like chemotaxis protein